MDGNLATACPCCSFAMGFQEQSSFSLQYSQSSEFNIGFISTPESFNIGFEDTGHFFRLFERDTEELFDMQMEEVRLRPYLFYDGPYEVTPSAQTQILHTESKSMARDVVVNPIPSNYGLITYNGSYLTVS